MAGDHGRSDVAGDRALREPAGGSPSRRGGSSAPAPSAPSRSSGPSTSMDGTRTRTAVALVLAGSCIGQRDCSGAVRRRRGECCRRRGLRARKGQRQGERGCAGEERAPQRWAGRAAAPAPAARGRPLRHWDGAPARPRARLAAGTATARAAAPVLSQCHEQDAGGSVPARGTHRLRSQPRWPGRPRGPQRRTTAWIRSPPPSESSTTRLYSGAGPDAPLGGLVAALRWSSTCRVARRPGRRRSCWSRRRGVGSRRPCRRWSRRRRSGRSPRPRARGPGRSRAAGSRPRSSMIARPKFRTGRPGDCLAAVSGVFHHGRENREGVGRGPACPARRSCTR